MTRALEGRVERLEDDNAGDDDLGQLTYDELMILRWYLARDLVADPKTSPGQRAACQRQIEDVEADIVAQAAQVASPDYARHLAWCRSLWKSRTGRDDYVPAVTGAMNEYGEYHNWDAPDLMRRRAALHALPAIRRLTGGRGDAPTASGHPAPLHLYCIFNERHRCDRGAERPGSDDADLVRWVTRKCSGGCRPIAEQDAEPTTPHPARIATLVARNVA
jgi:hypothetical protein